MSRAILIAAVAYIISIAALQPAHSGTKEDAFAAVERWVGAYSAADVDKVVASYTPDALFFGTTSPTLATTPDAIRKYFSGLPARTPRSSVKIGEYSAVVLSEEAVVFSGLYEFSLPSGLAPARFSFVAVKRGGNWLLAHHNSSAVPKPQ